jgi:AraC-like DNA-binding protein
MAGEDASPRQHGTRAQRELAASARRYISSRPGERIRVAEVGRALGRSAAYVADVFRRVEGIPLYRYILRKRLERAVRLLPTYASGLSVLALELDFSSHSHFTTAFARAFGCTPAFFRERSREVCRKLQARKMLTA